MTPRLRLQLFVFIVSIFFSQHAFSQCFQIESILVDACDTGSNEGFNEMVRFKVGSAAINTSTLSVTWPNNPWTGLTQNASTAAKVVLLNAQVSAAGGCGQILEPTGGVLPANAKVVLVTSYNFGVTANVFGALTENLYIIFQNNPSITTGHFANYNATSGIRTLSMNFGACSDTVSYDRSLLVNINGTSGGTAAEQNGSTVNFTPAGIATYINNGCVAPIDIFTVDAGPASISACPGAVISLSGTAVGQTSVLWSALSGTFSASASLVTNYSVPANASGSIVLTLTAINTCGSPVSDVITVNVSPTLIPTFNAVPSICTGATLNPLPTTSINAVTGTWSPSLNNTATTTYTFTPNAGQCAASTTLTIAVLPLVTPTFVQVPAICSGTTLQPLPTTSTNGIAGNWSPSLSNTATTTYTFTPNPGQCATTTTMTITVNNGNTIPTFNPIAPICSGSPLASLPTTSVNAISGSWSPALNNTATTTYTFTPNSGQCAAAVTLTIVVNPVVTPTFNAIPSICSGTALSPLPIISTNGIAGSWSPALNNTATTTYTFTPNAGQCAINATLTIVVGNGATPQFSAIAPICSGDVLPPLPTTSLNGISGTWSPALNNTATTTYTFTPDSTACSTSTTLTVDVVDFDIAIHGDCSSNNGFVLHAQISDELFDNTNSDFDWKNSNGISVGMNTDFNVSAYLNSTQQTETFPMVFSLTVTPTAGCPKTKSYTVENIYCDIQKGISPNGDSSNEFFDLAQMGVKKLSIFNRYGTKVYSRQGYTNQWKGQADNGNELPDATYYYVIDFNGNAASKSGWIYINR